MIHSVLFCCSQRGHQTFQRIAKTVKTICGINLVLKGYIQKAKIQSLLRKTRAFQVMPYIMQLEICQAAVYQQYEAKTIVLRKGHHSEACYFVLTGELIATLSDSCSENRNHLTGVVNEIQEGDLFGDFESILAGFLQQRYSAITELLR
ncbi:hypothetical protein chiPu_0003116 [Chiloscyllium punctatum]|uniref:Cyclic nucleotide-binding domain-containing protein n=1 Tax=Chiloscyllium punctatum TaxID=137246 RepID=A0A401S2V7_CHIPU|nr:hypothetical protein [Chiloscyllium punctatum]